MGAIRPRLSHDHLSRVSISLMARFAALYFGRQTPVLAGPTIIDEAASEAASSGLDSRAPACSA